MTLSLTAVTSALITLLSPKTEADEIHRLERQVRRRFVGQFATEVSPIGKRNDCIIEWVEWESSFGIGGEWAFIIQYTEGDLVGSFVTTSWKSLDFGAK